MQEYKIGSRGMVVLFPEPANQKAEAIMRSKQMTLASHEATPLTEEDLDGTFGNVQEDLEIRD